MNDFDEHLRTLMDDVLTDPNYAVPVPSQDLKLIDVNKIAGYFNVPVELIDEGLSGPSRPPTRRQRARWRWQAWRHIAGVKVGSLIAGFDLSSEDYD